MVASFRMIYTLLVSLCLAIDQIHGELLPQPSVRWTYRLDGAGGLSGRGLRKGNEVVAHKGGNLIFITADDGSLHILDNRSLENDSIVYEPRSVIGTYTECRSGVSQVEDKDGRTQYLLYAVIDTPVVSGVEIRNGELQSNTSVQVSSRVLAVNLDGTLRWSVPVEGIVAGKPLVGSDGTIYVSHNVETDSMSDRSDSRMGYVSIILAFDDGNAEVTASLSEAGNAPFGPLTLVSAAPQEGQQQQRPGEAMPDSVDYVAVAESWDYGYRAEGGVHMLFRTEQYDDLNGQGTDSYELRNAAFWPYSTVTRPTLNPTGESLWMNGHSSTVGGWTQNRDLSDVISGRDEAIFPRWTVAFQASERNASQPIMSAAVVSSDQSSLFFAGASYDLFCIEADSGREVWTDFTARSVHLMEPKLSEIDGSSVVYIIEQLKGNVRQHDAESGDRNWEFSCADLTGITSCQDAVEAEFSLAPSGNVLYYGDIFGNIIALEVADYTTDPPTSAPTGMPSGQPTATPTTTPYPTSLPTSNPTRAPFMAVAPSGEGVFNSGSTNEASVGPDDEDIVNNSLLVPILIGVAVGAVLVLALGLFLIAKRLKSDKKENMVIEEAQDPPDLEGTGGDDGSALSVERIGGATVYSAQATRKRKKKRAPPPPATPQTLASIEEDHEETSPASSPTVKAASPASSAVILIGDEASNEGTQNAGNGSGQGIVKNLNDTFSYVVEVQTDDDASDINQPEEIDNDEMSTDQSIEVESSEHGLVGTANGGSHLELSVGNNSNFRPINELNASRSLMDTASQSSVSSVEDDDKDTTEEERPSEEEKKEDENTVSPLQSQHSGSDTMSPGASSTNSSLYLDEDSSLKTKDTLSQPPRLPPVSPKILKSLSGDADVPEDERVSLRHSLGQPQLSHDAGFKNERSGGLAAPGSHYMTQSTDPASNSKFGQSVRPKRNVPRFLSSKARRNPSGYQGYESSDSEASYENRRAMNVKPSFKRASRNNSKIEEQQVEPKRDDSWTEFLQELEEAENHFFGPNYKASDLLQSDSDSDAPAPTSA